MEIYPTSLSQEAYLTTVALRGQGSGDCSIHYSDPHALLHVPDYDRCSHRLRSMTGVRSGLLFATVVRPYRLRFR